jgi:hypothetical protein
MLGLGTYAPAAVRVLDDLLDAGAGLELVELAPDTSTGVATTPPGSTLVAVIRDGVRLPPTEVGRGTLQGDRLIVLRESPTD